MIQFGEKTYYIDLEVIDKLVDNDESLAAQNLSELQTVEFYDEKGQLTGKEVTTRTYAKGKEIDASKYGTIMGFVETVMNYDDEIDETLGIERGLNASPLSFKIAFNTLLRYNILKEL
ncbi:MAG: hypothetical protein GTO02_17540 [Candidatus Dadabacteria bacterium]|nr:hypothetical protein [Candidatus Dadabacteria bacterium]